MQDDDIIIPIDDGNSASGAQQTETKSQDMYTKPAHNGIISYIEREVDRFDYDGYEVVRASYSQKPTVRLLR
jgi:hypothetical protein